MKKNLIRRVGGQILDAELKYILERKPTATDRISCARYILDEYQPGLDIGGVETLIRDWAHDCTTACCWCGRRYLNADLHVANGGWFCSAKCENEWREDEEFNEQNRAEMVADYKQGVL